MKPFVREIGQAVVIANDNIDTDQLIPARFMTRSRADGYGDLLFHDLRYKEDGSTVPDFLLNGLEATPAFLIAGSNFGCGSSREAAVYVLQDYGFRAIIARGFGDIFRSNAMKNGLLPVQLDEFQMEDVKRLVSADSGVELLVDLERQEVQVRDEVFRFEIDEGVKRKLLLGLDEVSETLQHAEEIEAFEALASCTSPWLLHPSKA